MRAPGAHDTPRPITEGERWTAEMLSELRRDRYRVRAWVAFVRGSLERARAVRTRRRRLADQAARWGVAGGAARIALGALARRGRAPQPSVAAGLAWWLLVWRMLDWHLGMAESDDGAPRDRLSAADAVTLARFWLVPVLAPSARSESGLPAVILLGGATDWLDGRLARHHGRTRLGCDLDTTADLAFFGTAVIVAQRAGRLPALGAWAFGLRYGLGLALSLSAFFGRARRPAIRAHPWAAILRVGGLTLSVAGHRTIGTSIVIAGCCVPPPSGPRASVLPSTAYTRGASRAVTRTSTKAALRR